MVCRYIGKYVGYHATVNDLVNLQPKGDILLQVEDDMIKCLHGELKNGWYQNIFEKAVIVSVRIVDREERSVPDGYVDKEPEKYALVYVLDRRYNSFTDPRRVLVKCQ